MKLGKLWCVSALAITGFAAIGAATPKKTAKAAADLLPLKHGFYVDASESCGSAPNISISLYEGRTLVGTRGKTCSVQAKKLAVSTWHIHTICDGGNPPNHIDDEQTVRVTGPASYEAIINGQAYPVRYCAPSEMPPGFSDVVIH